MRQALKGTTAIALAGMAVAPAEAAEWTVRVGGFMEQYVAYVDTDADFSGNPEQGRGGAGNPLGVSADGEGDFTGVTDAQDTEIHFLPRVTLDNGIVIGANVQLEGDDDGPGDRVDESFMFIEGRFGKIQLGSENSAGYLMTYAAPDVTIVGVNSGSLSFFVPFTGAGVGADNFRRTLGTSFLEVEGNNDAQRFTYFTPRFAGLQLGVSYARDGRQDDNVQVDEDLEISDIVDFGANYVNSFGPVNVAVSGRYGFADNPNKNRARGDGDTPEIWSVGSNLGYNLGHGTVTIGGSYAEADADHGLEEGEFFDVGISYETGPWGVSFTYAQGENVDDDVSDGFQGDPGDEELEQYLGGVTYAMAKGVNLNLWGAYVDFDNGNGDRNVGDIDAWLIGSGIRIDF